MSKITIYEAFDVNIPNDVGCFVFNLIIIQISLNLRNSDEIIQVHQGKVNIGEVKKNVIGSDNFILIILNESFEQDI